MTTRAGRRRTREDSGSAVNVHSTSGTRLRDEEMLQHYINGVGNSYEVRFPSSVLHSRGAGECGGVSLGKNEPLSSEITTLATYPLKAGEKYTRGKRIGQPLSSASQYSITPPSRLPSQALSREIAPPNTIFDLFTNILPTYAESELCISFPLAARPQPWNPEQQLSMPFQPTIQPSPDLVGPKSAQVFTGRRRQVTRDVMCSCYQNSRGFRDTCIDPHGPESLHLDWPSSWHGGILSDIDQHAEPSNLECLGCRYGSAHTNSALYFNLGDWLYVHSEDDAN
ncbi:hypothetical protein GQ53DRAFT_3016 [Thozetella sp. PMI_491]|nr:hypothetical protein GQ53DRAFT_3016 [Thozetella sp. PMI_491]